VAATGQQRRLQACCTPGRGRQQATAQRTGCAVLCRRTTQRSTQLMRRAARQPAGHGAYAASQQRYAAWRQRWCPLRNHGRKLAQKRLVAVPCGTQRCRQAS
jgi:hypothetical protein